MRRPNEGSINDKTLAVNLTFCTSGDAKQCMAATGAGGCLSIFYLFFTCTLLCCCAYLFHCPHVLHEGNVPH